LLILYGEPPLPVSLQAALPSAAAALTHLSAAGENPLGKNLFKKAENALGKRPCADDFVFIAGGRRELMHGISAAWLDTAAVVQRLGAKQAGHVSYRML
jgi:hypothetical protein